MKKLLIIGDAKRKIGKEDIILRKMYKKGEKIDMQKVKKWTKDKRQGTRQWKNKEIGVEQKVKVSSTPRPAHTPQAAAT